MSLTLAEARMKAQELREEAKDNKIYDKAITIVYAKVDRLTGVNQTIWPPPIEYKDEIITIRLTEGGHGKISSVKIIASDREVFYASSGVEPIISTYRPDEWEKHLDEIYRSIVEDRDKKDLAALLTDFGISPDSKPKAS